MSIFIGIYIYSLISINLDMVINLEFTRSSIFAFDLMVIGIIGMFMAFIGNILPIKRSNVRNVISYLVPVLLLVTTAFIYIAVSKI